MLNKIQNNIIETLGINKLPIEDQKEAMEKLGGIVYEETILKALEIMEEKDQEEFAKLVEKNPDPEIILTFLNEKIPNLEEIIKEEAEKLRNESSEIMSQIGK